MELSSIRNKKGDFYAALDTTYNAFAFSVVQYHYRAIMIFVKMYLFGLFIGFKFQDPAGEI